MKRDLVQLVFRSTLRNHGGKEPVSLWLIQPPEEVVMHVRESFRDCQHDDISELPFECLSELAAGRTFQGKPTHASKLLKWIADWDGSPILIAEVQGQLGMKPGQWKEARKNAAVKEAFKHIETDGSGKTAKSSVLKTLHERLYIITMKQYKPVLNLEQCTCRRGNYANQNPRTDPNR